MIQFNWFSRRWLYLPALLVLLVTLFTTRLGSSQANSKEEAQDQRPAGPMLSTSALQPASFQSVAPSFVPQTRLGFTSGDQWEPAIAADRSGHVYVLYPQLKGTPGCPDCSTATMILLISNDRGATWAAPRVI